MNILDYKNLTMTIVSILIIIAIFIIIAEIASVRVKPGSNEDFKQGISVLIVLLVGGTIFYGVLSHINDYFTDMYDQTAYEEDVRQRSLIARNKADQLEKLNTAPKEYERVLNGVKANNIVCWEDYLQNTDHVTVYVDDNRKIVRIITGQ